MKHIEDFSFVERHKLLDGKAIYVESENDDACYYVRDVIGQCMSNTRTYLIAEGLIDNLQELIDYAELRNVIFAKQKKGILKKSLSIFVAEVKGIDALNRILEMWVTTVYERRIILNTADDMQKDLISIADDSGIGKDFFFNIWPKINLLCENALDASNHNSFQLAYKDGVLK